MVPNRQPDYVGFLSSPELNEWFFLMGFCPVFHQVNQPPLKISCRKFPKKPSRNWLAAGVHFVKASLDIDVASSEPQKNITFWPMQTSHDLFCVSIWKRIFSEYLRYSKHGSRISKWYYIANSSAILWFQSLELLHHARSGKAFERGMEPWNPYCCWVAKPG